MQTLRKISSDIATSFFLISLNTEFIDSLHSPNTNQITNTSCNWLYKI